MYLTSDHRKYCQIDNTTEYLPLTLFQDSDFIDDLEELRKDFGREEIYVCSGVEHLFL